MKSKKFFTKKEILTYEEKIKKICELLNKKQINIQSCLSSTEIIEEFDGKLEKITNPILNFEYHKLSQQDISDSGHGEEVEAVIYVDFYIILEERKLYLDGDINFKFSKYCIDQGNDNPYGAGLGVELTFNYNSLYHYFEDILIRIDNISDQKNEIVEYFDSIISREEKILGFFKS